MNQKDLKRTLPFLIKAGIVPLIIGHKGTGKTQISYALGKELGYDRVYNFRLALCSDAGDITGLPNFIVVDGEERTSFRPPEYLPRKGEKVLIVLDEINRVQNRQILNAIFQMVEKDRKIGTYEFPADTAIIALANPATAEYSGTLDFRDEAFKSRFCHIFYSPTNEEYLSYINSKGNFHKSVTTFLSNVENHDFIHGKKDMMSIDYMNPDHRAWQYVSDFMGQNPDEELVLEVVTGLVGTVAATRFYDHLQNNKQKNPITLQDVLTNNNLEAQVKDRLDHPELLDQTMIALKAEVNNRSTNNQTFTPDEIEGMRVLVANSNKELSLKFFLDVLNENSLILSMPHVLNLYNDPTVTEMAFKAAGIIQDGEEHKLIGIHDKVEIIEEETEEKQA